MTKQGTHLEVESLLLSIDCQQVSLTISANIGTHRQVVEQTNWVAGMKPLNVATSQLQEFDDK